MKSLLLLIVFFAVALRPEIISARVFFAGPETQLQSLVNQVTAGDSIILKNGRWADAVLTFDQLSGTADRPIHIRAETPGQVVFTGATEFRFSGQYVVVSGLVFQNSSGASDVVQLRTHSQRHAHHCRLTECVFEEEPSFDVPRESRWLSIYGTHNRIDHCMFAGKKSRGTTVVVWVEKEPQHHRIDHNHFGHRPELGRNGGETVRVGTSDVSENDSVTTVEHNYFHGCDGEAEVISNKSCGNVYRYNVFDECSGALTLRHGHRCLVEGNVFIGRKKRGTGGVRIIGRSHRVINNYFEGLRGDAERAALSIMNGIPQSPLNGYAPVRSATVSHNTFVDCKVSLEIGVGAGRRQSEAPVDCRITHNVFIPDKWQVFRWHVDVSSFDWSSNLQHLGSGAPDASVTFKKVDLRLQRASDGLLRPVNPEAIAVASPSDVELDIDGESRGQNVFCGCDLPGSFRRRMPDPEITGPTWKRHPSEP